MNNTTPARYTITVDADELPLIAALLGRDLAPKRAPKPRAKAQAIRRAPMPKPPKLTDNQRGWVESEWKRVAQHPVEWHAELAQRVAKPMGYRDRDDVARAWGPPNITDRLIADRAAR